MASPTKIEFAVRMTCQGCVNSVKKALDEVPGIESVEVRLEAEQVIVSTSLPSSQVKDLIEGTGKQAVLIGYGGSSQKQEHLGAAVAMMEAGSSLIKGVVRFVQSDKNICVVDGTLDGLPRGKYTVCVHELGDISQGCSSCGEILGGHGMGLTEKVRGIVTELQVGENGRATFRIDIQDLKVWNLIGRSLIVHNGSADKISNSDNSNRLVCGIIARSAGLFQNYKKICACDGVSIWEERNVPIAGGRQEKVT